MENNRRTQDIGVSNAAYNTALALYFLAYVTFEVPANVCAIHKRKTRSYNRRIA